MPKFAALMDELREMGCLDADGKVAVDDKSNGKGTIDLKEDEPEEIDEEEDGDDEPEVVVTNEEREGFSQLLDRASQLSREAADKLAEFSDVLGTLKVMVESARDAEQDTEPDAEPEEDTDQEEEESYAPIPEPK